MRTTLAAVTLTILTALLAQAGQIITVMSKTAVIRADKQFYAPAAAQARYGDQLAVVEEKGGWYKVTFGGKTGWIHGSAITKGAVTVAAAGFKKTASSEDVALAGKGFNEQVEGKYKKEHPEMNFSAVDRMEKIAVDDSAIARFAAEGGLKGREVK